MGVTGERASLASSSAVLAQRLKAVTAKPVVMGFGISGPDQAVAATRARRRGRRGLGPHAGGHRRGHARASRRAGRRHQGSHRRRASRLGPSPSTSPAEPARGKPMGKGWGSRLTSSGHERPPAGHRPATGAGAGAAFFTSLDHEWRALARSMAFARAGAGVVRRGNPPWPPGPSTGPWPVALRSCPRWRCRR